MPDTTTSMTSADPHWPNVSSEVERRFPKPFSFEVGARYWYSSGTTNFAFTNGDPSYGNPTSEIDWNGTQGHAGEIFGRVDHRPSGVFVKGVIGAGGLTGGEMLDRDYYANQVKFSDTSSDVRGNSLRYATIDIGYAYELPRYGVRIGGFVGYHYWREKMTAYGITCNADDMPAAYSNCWPPGSVPVAYDTAVMIYEPTWHAVRLGIDGRAQVNRRWSVAGEAAFVPVAWLENKDSHLLRQSPADLGPAPNIISKGRWGLGAMAEVFVNYAVTPQIEAGIGFRYWSITAGSGHVQMAGQEFELTEFSQQRYGLLVQVKGRL